MNLKSFMIVFFSFCFFKNLAYSQSKFDAETYARALKGDVESIHNVGYYYYEMNMPDSAIYWLTKSATKGNLYSQSTLGQIYENKEIPDYTKAMFWYEKSAKQGYNWSLYRIGHFYHYGLGVEADENKAKQWLKKSAELGYCFGLPQYEYGKFYAEGNEAKMWLLKSYEAGCSEALVEIGLKYKSGFFKQNSDSVFQYFNMASMENNANGYFWLSDCYALGIGCEQSYKKALELYQKAEELNSSSLLEYKTQNNNLSNAPFEYDEANDRLSYKPNASFNWYRAVAFDDNAASNKCRLACCYLTGEHGVKQNVEEGTYWALQAAESDIFEAQVLMAQIYEEIGDTENARYWYERGLNCENYMFGDTSTENYEKMKEKCISALERLKKSIEN